jgi:hypothetical protein
MFQIMGRDGQVYGPANTEELKAWCERGRFDRNTIVIDPITSQTGPVFRMLQMLSDYDVLPAPVPPLPYPATPPVSTVSTPSAPSSPQAQPELGTRFLGMFIDGLIGIPSAP